MHKYVLLLMAAALLPTSALADATRRLERDFTDHAFAEQQRLLAERRRINDRLASLAGNE